MGFQALKIRGCCEYIIWILGVMTYQVVPTDAALIGLNTETMLIIVGNNLSGQYI